MNEKMLFVFAGPNGSGKSTVVKNFIVSGLISDEDYICPDNEVKEIKENNPELDEYAAYIRAMQTTERTRRSYVRKGHSFSFETVFSNPDKLKFLRFAKAYGFHIVVVYITTADPSINVRRVVRRVSEGGHDVPEDKIRARYERSMSLMSEVVSFADEAEVYDNSVDEAAPVLVFKKRPDGRMAVVPDTVIWAERYLLRPLRKMGYVISVTPKKQE